jgi:predicted nucleotidyltransferase
MMIELQSWMQTFLQLLNTTFADRVWFAGLQGSYARGEATETSDIDLVVILDQLTPADIQSYHTILDRMPHREKICGFLSGKKEILNWEPADLFQFYYDTQPILGSLDDLLPMLDDTAVCRAIKIGAGNVYHGCVHNMLYEKNDEILKGLYKAASFVVQAICFFQTGRYVNRQSDLLAVVSPEEQLIVKTFMDFKKGGKVDFLPMSEALFAWSAKWITQ